MPRIRQNRNDRCEYKAQHIEIQISLAESWLQNGYKKDAPQKNKAQPFLRSGSAESLDEERSLCLVDIDGYPDTLTRGRDPGHRPDGLCRAPTFADQTSDVSRCGRDFDEKARTGAMSINLNLVRVFDQGFGNEFNQIFHNVREG